MEVRLVPLDNLVMYRGGAPQQHTLMLINIRHYLHFSIILSIQSYETQSKISIFSIYFPACLLEQLSVR